MLMIAIFRSAVYTYRGREEEKKFGGVGSVDGITKDGTVIRLSLPSPLSEPDGRSVLLSEPKRPLQGDDDEEFLSLCGRFIFFLPSLDPDDACSFFSIVDGRVPAFFSKWLFRIYELQQGVLQCTARGKSGREGTIDQKRK